MSCSGTCLIFRIPRQPNVRTAETALGPRRDGEPTTAPSGSPAPRCPSKPCRWSSGVAHAASTSSVSASSASAGRPVRARKTSSRLGWPSENPAIATSRRRQLRDRLGAAIRVVARHRERGWIGLELDGCRARGRGSRQRSVRWSGSSSRDVERAGADRRLQLRGRALGDHLAVIDHGDALGQLVGLVEVLRAEEDRGALLGQRPDDAPDLVARARIEARRGLVEEHQLRA